jgi:hypothetical protein
METSVERELVVYGIRRALAAMNAKGDSVTSEGEDEWGES